MGGQISSNEANINSHKITQNNLKEFKEECGVIKLLLLGTGQSGKSTIVKQMKLIHLIEDGNGSGRRGFTVKEKMEAQVAIYLNMTESMLSLIDAVCNLTQNSYHELEVDIQECGTIIKDYGIRIIAMKPSERMKSKETIIECLVPPDEVKNALKELWSNKLIQAAYARRNEFQIMDSTQYFMSCLDRMCANDFIPTDQDVLRTRVQTTGVVRTRFEFGGKSFEMFDVGGQRSERKKWIHCFDNVTCVLFVVNIAEFDLVLEEDPSANRMLESMKVFDEIANNSSFKNTPFIIFFNKYDLFLEKISRVGINTLFPDYQGPLDSANESIKFLTEKYLSLNKTDIAIRRVYPHITIATDTDDIKMVISSVTETIMGNIS